MQGTQPGTTCLGAPLDYWPRHGSEDQRYAEKTCRATERGCVDRDVLRFRGRHIERQRLPQRPAFPSGRQPTAEAKPARTKFAGHRVNGVRSIDTGHRPGDIPALIQQRMPIETFDPVPEQCAQSLGCCGEVRPRVLNVDQSGLRFGRCVGEPPSEAVDVVLIQRMLIFLVVARIWLAQQECLDPAGCRGVVREGPETLAECAFRLCRAVERPEPTLGIVVSMTVVILRVAAKGWWWRRRFERLVPTRHAPEPRTRWSHHHVAVESESGLIHAGR